MNSGRVLVGYLDLKTLLMCFEILQKKKKL